MASVHIEDGKIVQSNSATSLANEVNKNKSTLDKDAFLGLLVAQMKYQDPLEPTSNTEFISQFAQFSSLEQMQNMSATLELSRASSLVGKIVSVNITDSNGNPQQLQGKVDYILYENNKAYVSIGGNTYSLDDVYGVADQGYLDAYDLAVEFTIGINKLPKKEDLTLEDKEALDKLNKIYKEMSDYEKTFITQENVKILEDYTKRMDELVKDKEETMDFTIGLNRLPKLEELTLDDKEAVDALNKMYEELPDNEKSYISSDNVKKLKEYTKRIEELVKEGEA